MSGASLHQVKVILRSLINSTPKGMTIEDLDRDYRDLEGQPIPFVQLGYRNLIVFLQSLDDTLLLRRNSSGMNQVFAIQTKMSEHINLLVQQQKPPKHMNKKPANRRQQMNIGCSRFQNFRSPQFCSNQPPQYHTHIQQKKLPPAPRQMPTEQLPPHRAPQQQHRRAVDRPSTNDRYGFDSQPHNNHFSQTTSYLPAKEVSDSSDDMQPSSSANDSPSFYKSTTNHPNFHRQQSIVSLSSSSGCPSPNHTPSEKPRSVDTHHFMPFATHIGLARLPADVKPGSVFGIFVAEINSPSRFWFHIQNDDSDLDDLMYRIEKSYASITHDHMLIQPELLRPGRICAALYDELWHRGEIVRVHAGRGTAVVHFIDYGTTFEVLLTDIKYLLDEFARLPCQVYRGCLAFVQPVGERWSREASMSFYNSVIDKMVFAIVKHIDQEERVLSLKLLDTTTDVDVDLNAELIRHGFAETPYPEDKNMLRQRPTFTQLEAGTYPTMKELDDLLALGIDYEAMYNVRHENNPFCSWTTHLTDALNAIANYFDDEILGAGYRCKDGTTHLLATTQSDYSDEQCLDENAILDGQQWLQYVQKNIQQNVLQ